MQPRIYHNADIWLNIQTGLKKKGKTYWDQHYKTPNFGPDIAIKFYNQWLINMYI